MVHEESEQSDDELLSLSSQHSNASGDKPHGTPKHGKKQQELSAPPPPEDVDLLGLDGSPMSKTFPSQLAAAPSNSDLLSDLFGVGGPGSQGQSTQPAADEVFHMAGPGSVQSTPRHSAASASPSPSPRVGEGNAGSVGGVAFLSGYAFHGNSEGLRDPKRPSSSSALRLESPTQADWPGCFFMSLGSSPRCLAGFLLYRHWKSPFFQCIQ